ncbi:MAG: hypothetical protein AAF098_15435 [Pseudomonadota bacterium]
MMKSAPERKLWNFPTMVCVGCTIMPFVAVHGAFFISASFEFVNWCNPYWDSCTSISATGRRAPASYWFRGLMLPVAMLMIVYWWLHWSLLRNLGQRGARSNTMFACGVAACVGLAAYVTVLGEIGDLWRLQRRIGAILFFSLTFLGQLLLASGLRSTLDSPTAEKKIPAVVWSVGNRLLRICQLLLLIGIVSVLVQLYDEALHDNVEDAIEWQLALLLQINFMFTVALWWRPWWNPLGGAVRGTRWPNSPH